MGRAVTFAAVGFALSIANSALAQEQAQPAPSPGRDDQAGQSEEIVVTARRREERLIDVPVAASVVSAADIAARGGIASSLELLTGQAGVRFSNTTSSLTQEISIRGSSTARGTQSESAVGLYRDGMYVGGGALGGRNFQRMDLFDIDRVEILRGTQGALYGRNAVGGVVNIVSTEPKFENSGFVDVKYLLDPQSPQVQAVGNFKLSDTWALRIGGDYINQDEGFFFNSTNNVYFDQQNGSGLRGQALYRDERLKAKFLVEHQQLNAPAIMYRGVIAPGPGFPRGYVQPEFDYPWNTRPSVKQQMNMALASFTYGFDWGQLDATFMVRERDSFFAIDLDLVNPALLTALRANGTTVVTEANSAQLGRDETRIVSQDVHLSGGETLAWLVGIEHFDLSSESATVTTRTPTLANPSPGTNAPASIAFESWAAYGSLTWALSERAAVSAELRQTFDDKTFSARRFDLRTGLASGGGGFVADAATDPSNLSYNLVASYRPMDGVLAYAKYGTAYRAGGFNNNLGDPRQPIAIPAAYENETSGSFEIGLKAQFDNGFAGGVSGYRTATEDQIVQLDNGCAATVPACPVVATNFLTNAGEGRAWGIEAEGRQDLDLGFATLRLSAAVSRQDGEIVSGRFNGFAIPQLPEWIASFGVTARAPIGDSATLFANANGAAQWGGVQELAAANFKLDDFQTLNLRAGIEFGSMQASVFVNNATDTQYRVFRTSTTERYNIPRVYGVQLRASF